MNLDEINKFLEDNPDVEWKDDEKGITFHSGRYDKPGEGVHIEYKTLEYMPPAELNRVIVNGRNIDHITRVTGYFSKISGWNKGKTGELKDRARMEI